MAVYSTTAITITDTGKRRTSSASAEETDLVNSGSSITLSGVQISLDQKALLNTAPSIGKLTTPSDAGTKYANAEVDVLGMSVPAWQIQGRLDLDNSTDRGLLQDLRELTQTKGYKILTGDLPDLIDGSDDASSVNVHVSSVKLIQLANSNIISYTISMMETA
jgi:hypothetical protein